MGLYAAKSAVLVAAQLELGNQATRLFFHMALECWDDEDNPAGQVPRRYFGRRELSALALGYLAPANGSSAAFQAVKRATKELVEKGALVRVRHGGSGMAAEFELQVPVDRPRRAQLDGVVVPFRSLERGVDSRSPQRSSF